MLGQTPGFESLRDQIEFQVTAEGLRIELIEGDGSSFFDSGSAVLRGAACASSASSAASSARSAMTSWSKATPTAVRSAPADQYSNWELSADRANAARRVMEAVGLNPGQVQSVRGFAATQLRLPGAPMDARNRRVSIVVRSHSQAQLEQAMRQGGQAAQAAADPGAQAPAGSASHAPAASAVHGSAATPTTMPSAAAPGGH